MTEPSSVTIDLPPASPDPGRWPSPAEWRRWFLALDDRQQLEAARFAVQNAQTCHDRRVDAARAR